MSPFAAFFRAAVVLLLVTLIEKVIFAVHHDALSAPLSLTQLADALLKGVRFDVAVTASFALLSYAAAYVLTRFTRISFVGALRPLVYLSVTLLVFVHGADLLYFAEAGRHLGYEIMEAYNSGAELAGAALRSYTATVAWQMGLLLLALAAVRFALPSRPAPRRMFAAQKRWYEYFAPEARLLAILTLSVLMIRGGFQSIPLEPLHAQELGDTRKAALALNGAYNAFYSMTTPYAVTPLIARVPDPEQLALVRSLYPDRAHTETSATRANVVILFLESWSANFLKSYGDGAATATTPFFDEWRTRGLSTREMLAGGQRTTEGLFSTLCSAQNPLGETVAQSQLQNYDYHCLPKVLRDKGYRTAFFQGTVSGTSGTGAFAQLLGFEESYGKEHVKTSALPHNSWGLHDPDEYRFALERMAAMPQPFLVGINTNSTHDFILPPGAEAPFDDATKAGRFRNVLHFADASLKDFIQTLEARFPNTIVVALADHAGITEGPAINRARIPFVIYGPGHVAPRLVDTVASQRDVAPTLVEILGLPPVPWFTGHSLLDPAPFRVADYYEGGILGWVEGDFAVEMPVRGSPRLRCYAFREAFPEQDCAEAAQAAARRGFAFTTVAQHLLFEGRLKDFAQIHAQQR